MLANSDSADNGAIGTKRGASPDKRVAILILASDGRTRVVNIGEHHARSAEHIVFKRYIVVDAHIVLDLDIVSNRDAVSDKHILPERAAFTNSRAAADMHEVPHS